jgi:hypothetical protein
MDILVREAGCQVAGEAAASLADQAAADPETGEAGAA